MDDLVEDLRAALDQMNRNLSKIADENEKQTKLLEQLIDSSEES